MDNRDAIRVKFLKKARDAINQKLAGREIHIIKAVNLLGDLDSVGNLLKENTSEWKLRKPAGEAENVYLQLEKNAGSIDAEKKELTQFIEKEMVAEFPNFSVLATPIIGAKLLSSAGSKKRLCFMPASTIQVLGAEKALFAHIRRDAKSPKHGHLFNHPLMQKLPRFKRGKVARILAGKLAIALKQDYFGGENTSKEALKEIEEHIAKIAAEPVTPKQQEREQKLQSDHSGERGRQVESRPASKPESRTWTPEERREYFKKQNQGKPAWQGKPSFGGETHKEKRFSNRQDNPRDARGANYTRGETKNKNFGKGRFNKPKHSHKRF